MHKVNSSDCFAGFPSFPNLIFLIPNPLQRKICICKLSCILMLGICSHPFGKLGLFTGWTIQNILQVIILFKDDRLFIWQMEWQTLDYWLPVLYIKLIQSPVCFTCWNVSAIEIYLYLIQFKIFYVILLVVFFNCNIEVARSDNLFMYFNAYLTDLEWLQCSTFMWDWYFTNKYLL